jgi:hypothetical protein
MEMSFFALPSKQGPVKGRFKPTHRPISLSTKVPACVRCFETPTPLNHGRPALALSFKSFVWIGEYFTSQLPYSCLKSQVWARDRAKKRHLHAQHTVSFIYNPEAKRQGHVLEWN